MLPPAALNLDSAVAVRVANLLEKTSCLLSTVFLMAGNGKPVYAEMGRREDGGEDEGGEGREEGRES